MAAIAMLVSLPAPARAQSGADVSPTILVHPDVPTMVYLPDSIEGVQVRHGGEMMVRGIGAKLYVRPRPDTPAGLEALLEVKTRTVHRIFVLQVVERAADATREIVVPPVAAADDVEEATRDVPPEAPARQEPADSVASPAPEIVPEAFDEATERDVAAAAAATERGTAVTGAPRFELSAHGVMGLGVIALDPAGYDPQTGLQPHGALGLRLAGAPRGGWWALEAEASGELLAGPLVYDESGGSRLNMSGPWLRAMLGMRVQSGTRWIPSAYAGIGAHAHLRELQEPDQLEEHRSLTMRHGAVLALGMGLQYRTGDVLLGLDFRVRFGEPDAYRSIAAFVAVGRVLDQGD